MAKQVGDNLHTSITRSGFANIQITITRATPPGAEQETLKPAKGGVFIENKVYKEGLDGSIQVQYHQFDIDIEFLQCDSETLADLMATALDAQFEITGVSTVLTFMNGMTKTITLKWLRTPQGGEYNSVISVKMHGKATYATSIFA
jgi:hypothetical protein